MSQPKFSRKDHESAQIEETELPSETDWKGLSLLKYSASVQSIASAIASWRWSSSFDFSEVQARFAALLLELGLGPGSLYSEVVNDAPDLTVYPECEWDAEVRLGEDMCLSERAFLGERKRRMKASFAKLMGVPESQVDERDLPIVAIAGSGGGYRAMLNTLGSLSAADSMGLLDCITYTAGVSGSCWALGVLYSGVAGSHAPNDAAQFIKDRIQTSYLDTATLDALITPPTNKYLLSGILRKAAGPTGMVSLVDLYGTLLSSRLFVPHDTHALDFRHLSLHFFRRNVDDGKLPLPILSAIQATPMDKAQALRDIKAKKTRSVNSTREDALSQEQGSLEHDFRCLWYEFTPYEIGCDEIGGKNDYDRTFLCGQFTDDYCSVDTFVVARTTVSKREEYRTSSRVKLHYTRGDFWIRFLRLPQGRCVSTPRRQFIYGGGAQACFREIQPTLQLLPEQLYRWLEEIVTENENDLGLIHPVLPDQLPNFLKGLDGQLRYGSPPDLTERETLSFMEVMHLPAYVRKTSLIFAAELNIPYSPLLRRNVDCIIALDASADSQDLWFTKAEELAAKRGLSTWPRGTGWPSRVQCPEATTEPTIAMSSDEVNLKLAHTQESALAKQIERLESTEDRDMPEGAPLSSCEVWIGSSTSDGADSSRLDDLDEEALLQRDGIGVVYLPLVPNEQRVPGFDPFVVSTWRREASAEESQKLLDVAEANFTESREKIVRLLRAIWLRKKRERTHRVWEHDLVRLRKRLRDHLH
ncbi:Cytosolic phospholipase A2 [Grifola frondosa]|uniref:Lysophospholipase n=1 Tax=Grifola frondosa TaxID=5627 RepID=A0A1C7M740_GRIFR|nr:Cytosolic phospholipase A2 [Grifola frondosa]